MSNDLEWVCAECRSAWLADFEQLVCRKCGGERVVREREVTPRRREMPICFGDLIAPQPERIGR